MTDYQLLKFAQRKDTDSMKWDGLDAMFGRSDLLPLWVADMDIESPECVKRALASYVDANVFGYYRPRKGYYDAFMDWEREWHGFDIDREWIRFVPGVVPGLYWSVQAFTEPGDAVATMTPVYYPFANSVKDTGRTLVEVPLVNRGGVYSMDLGAFERAVEEHDVKLFVLCSPHNPVGRVWTEGELRGALDVCKRHGVIVLSDEIHHDLVLSGHEHVVAATLGDYADVLVTFMSASKTFNLAACGQAFAIIESPRLRERFDRFACGLRMNAGHSFSYVAYEAAYRGGRPWLEELLHLISENQQLLVEGLADALPRAVVSPLEGTYLAWVDLGPYVEGRDTQEAVCGTCKLAVDFGSWFGGGELESFIRVNLATHPENVREATRRLSLLG